MTAHGDEIRALAARVGALAELATDEAARVAARGGVQWDSSGAERFRSQLRHRSEDYRACADDIRALRHSLLAHAERVDKHTAILGAVVDALT